MTVLLNLDNCTQTSEVIMKYWQTFWKGNENLRFSDESKKAYNTFKSMLKYHLFQKRDGGIINQLILDDKSISNDPEVIGEQLFKTLAEIQIDENYPYIQKEEFPQLTELTQSQMEAILEQLSTNKAPAWDGLSDLLFCRKQRKVNGIKQPSNLQLTAHLLKNIWSMESQVTIDMEKTWEARLVALNKIFPGTPDRFQMRPIIIQSPLVKILESRFLPPLQEYLTYKLDRAQTGFINGIGIQANLTRVLERITIRTKQKRPVYGLFIDFANAYNNVPHSLLFQKLRTKNIFSETEVKFLEQLYTRYNLKIGKNKLYSNKGLAQGSLISPALFNLFIEDLSIELETKANINQEDRMYYADDLLILATSVHQLEKAIEVVEEWSLRNGMKLNRQKSGVVIFASRKAKNIPFMKNLDVSQKIIKKNSPTEKEKIIANNKSWTPTQMLLKGIPLCNKYKYLGTWLESKLTCGSQIGQIKKKSAHIFIQMYPYLKNASADARRDLWLTMVSPLFDVALLLLEYEPSESKRKHLEIVRRTTFENFLMISKRTNTTLVDMMIGKNLLKVAHATTKANKEIWEQRKAHMDMTAFVDYSKSENEMRAVPNSWCELINTMVRPCPACQKTGIVMSRWHLLTKHKMLLPHINHIWKKEIVPITTAKIQKKIENIFGSYSIIVPEERDTIRQKLKLIIQGHLDDFNKVFGELIVGTKPYQLSLKYNPGYLPAPEPDDQELSRVSE